MAAQLCATPRPALIGFAALSVVLAVLNWAPWLGRAESGALDYAGGALAYLLSLGAIYVAATLMIERPRSWMGLGKFIATFLAMIAPVAIAVGLVLAELPLAFIVLVAPLLLIGIFLLSFLQGWPLLQATSRRWIGPKTAWALTKGIRWPLFIGSSITGSLTRMGPDIAAAQGATEKGLAIAGDGLLTFLSLAFAAAFTVEAWRHMQARLDETKVAPTTPVGRLISSAASREPRA
jgi:hypothetical protein